MNGTEAAANFVKRLPLSQPFENFGKLERITYLKPALDTGKDALAASPKRGDLAYYIPWGNLCVFLIGGNAPSDDLVILRHMGEEALAALEKSGTSRVELREKKKPDRQSRMNKEKSRNFSKASGLFSRAGSG